MPIDLPGYLRDEIEPSTIDEAIEKLQEDVRTCNRLAVRIPPGCPSYSFYSFRAQAFAYRTAITYLVQVKRNQQAEKQWKQTKRP